MEPNRTVYREDLDILKGLAIIAVVLYHMGITKSGYLGVDVFFVINGYLIMPKVLKDVANDKFHYFNFLLKRTLRLLPLMLIVSAVSLFIGYWGMLPDDYENLCESVVASNFFSNNILAAITTKNYWDVVNEYKPLMHTWYIGILFEFYLVFPLIAMGIKWMSKVIRFDYWKHVLLTFVFITILSFLLFLNPFITQGDKFYYLLYRLYELTLGGLAAMFMSVYQHNKLLNNHTLSGIGFLLIIILLFGGVAIIGDPKEGVTLAHYAYNANYAILKSHLLILVVFITTFLVISDNMISSFVDIFRPIKVGILGLMSYSIFLWHQPILAFYRYFFTNDLSLTFIIIFGVSIISISCITYNYVEKKTSISKRTSLITVVSLLVVSGLAFGIYKHAGVVRDVPELEVKMDNVHPNMFAEYNDIIYSYDRDFPDPNGNINVLVIGNSFARDWGNILLESTMADKINLSYIYSLGESDKYDNRIKKSEYIFYHGLKQTLPQSFWKIVRPDTEVWGIGTKEYGQSNGSIYVNRFKDNYYDQTATISKEIVNLNNALKKDWGDKYIDFLKIVEQGDGVVRVFTDNHKFISQDCRHLTKSGAKYYASHICFEHIFNKSFKLREID